ncbi:MAG: type II toxin-antitoxin system death-on-curing family toxin [Balneolales bacterium]
MKFLTKKIILYFHEDQIAKYGGSEGILDENLLESALGQARVSFGGQFLCKDVFEMAATYGYHIGLDQPFMNGNKRITLVSMYTFLYMNGWHLSCDPKELYLNIIALTRQKIDKKELTHFLKSNCKRIKV